MRDEMHHATKNATAGRDACVEDALGITAGGVEETIVEHLGTGAATEAELVTRVADCYGTGDVEVHTLVVDALTRLVAAGTVEEHLPFYSLPTGTAPTLTQALAARGMSHRPAEHGRRDIVKGGVVVFSGTAHDTWTWLRAGGAL